MFFSWPNDEPPLRRSDKVPDHLQKYALPFAQYRYELYKEGEILSQLIVGHDYSIWMHHFIMKQDTLVHPNVNTSILTINYMLLGQIHAVLKNAAKVIMKAGVCSMYYVPENIYHEAILPRGVSSCLHINFHPDHLVPIATQYPVFEPMLSKAIGNIHNGKMQVEVVISSAMKEELEKIISCNLGTGERELFFQARIRDLLRMYGTAQAQQQAIEQIDNPHDKIIAKIEYYIDQNLDKDLSIDKLADYINASRAWIQMLFSKKYKRGIHKIITEKRMKVAADWLIKSDICISDIVLKTSTMTFAAFSTAFKKFHKLSPSEYRERYSQNKKK